MIRLYSPYKGKKGIKRIINAFYYSITGLVTVYQHETAFRQIILMNLVLIPLSFFINVSSIERVLMIAGCLLAIVIELFNSALKAVVDRISLERHILSKNSKDMGSAAQLIASFIILNTWLIIFKSLIFLNYKIFFNS